MKASEVMQRPVLATTLRASVRDVATQIVVNEISGMPVTDQDGRVLGVITEADIMAALIDGKNLEDLTAQDLMSPEPITVDADTPMDEVMRLLEECGVLRVPVTSQGKVVGIISRRDIIRSVLEPEFLTFG
ncbi:MAG: histidine kinase [Acidobacteria bacterium RIFCSPLOWO2_02_FULL_61_28]|nr:MAG: histidine kinase [Acidobacteria bacterium RIFCSPLOWO2_02_FULL_61_28]